MKWVTVLETERDRLIYSGRMDADWADAAADPGRCSLGPRRGLTGGTGS